MGLNFYSTRSLSGYLAYTQYIHILPGSIFHEEYATYHESNLPAGYTMWA